MLYYFNYAQDVENRIQSDQAAAKCCSALHESGIKEDFLNYLKNTYGERDKGFYLRILFDCADYLQSLHPQKNTALKAGQGSAVKDEKDRKGHNSQYNKVLSYDILINCIENIESRHPQSRLYNLAIGNAFLRKAQYLDEIYMPDTSLYEKAIQRFKLLGWNQQDEDDLRQQLRQWIKEGGEENESAVWKAIAASGIGKCYRNWWAEDNYKRASEQFSKTVSLLQPIIVEENCYSFEVGQSNNERLLQIFHIYLNAINNLGICQMKQSNLKEAQEEFNKIIDFYCGLPAIQNLHAALQDLRSSGGIKDSELKADGKGLNPYSLKNECSYLIQAIVNLGILKRKQSKFYEAIPIFEFLLKRIDPSCVDATNNLGICWRKLGKNTKAITFFQNLLIDNPQNLSAELNVLKCRIKSREYKGVEKELERLREENENNPEVSLLTGLYYRDRADYNKAYQIFQSICGEEAFPKLVKGSMKLKAYYNQGVCLLSQNKFSQAKKFFKQILACIPDDTLAGLNYGWCLQNLGDYPEAIKIYQSLQKGNIQQYTTCRLLNNLGQCYYFCGEWEKAQEKFEEILKMEPQNSSVLCHKANCLMRKGKYSDAYTYYRLSLEISPLQEETTSQYIQCIYQIWKNSGPAEESRDQTILKELQRQLNSPVKYYNLAARQSLCRYLKCLKGAAAEAAYQHFADVLPLKREEGYGAFYKLLHGPAFQELGQQNPAKPGQLLMLLYQIQAAIQGIKFSLRVGRNDLSENIRYVHYTKMNTLKILLSQKEGQKPRFRLWNSIYMNDPSEGKMFLSLLRKSGQEDYSMDRLLSHYYPQIQQQNSPIPGENNVYLTSLSAADDSIHMWVQYADNAQGCAIAFDDDFFDIKYDKDEKDTTLYSDADVPIYRVLYFYPDASPTEPELAAPVLRRSWEIVPCLAEIEALLNSESKEIQDTIYTFVAHMLNEIRFLLKDAEYESEKEYRVVICTDQPKIDEDTFPIPRLYTEVDKEIAIREVQLGPRTHQTQEIAAWLYATGKVSHISKSERHYR